MPSKERLGLRAWLELNLNDERYSGVKWVDKTSGVFSISWKHASRHGWDEDEDAAIFKEWAVHTGRYRADYDAPNPKTWKANFRCAMNASRDIKVVQDQSLVKGKNACRIFEFSKHRKSRINVATRATRVDRQESAAATLNIRSRSYMDERKRNIRLAARRHKYVKAECVNAMKQPAKNEPEEASANIIKTIQQVLVAAEVKCEEKTDSVKTAKEEKCSRLFSQITLPQRVQQVQEKREKQSFFTEGKCEKQTFFGPLIKKEIDYNCHHQGQQQQQQQPSETLFSQQKLDAKYFSFAELLEKIPRDIPSMSSPPRLSSSPTFESLPASIDEEIVKDLLRYVVASDINSADSSDAEDIAEMFDEGVHIHKTMKELENILKPQQDTDNDITTHMHNAGAQLPPLSSINAPFFTAMSMYTPVLSDTAMYTPVFSDMSAIFTPVLSDTFLGEDYDKSDKMTRALKASFVYELQ